MKWRLALAIGLATGALTGLAIVLLTDDDRYVVDGSPGDYVAIRHAFKKDQSKRFEPSPSTLERSTWEFHYTVTDDRSMTNQWVTVIGDGQKYRIVIENGQQIITNVNTGEVTIESTIPMGEIRYSPAEPISETLREFGLELVGQEERYGRTIEVWAGKGEHLRYPERTVYYVDVETGISIGYERFRVNTEGVEELIESDEWESIRKK